MLLLTLSEGASSILQLITMVILFILVLVLTYFVTRWIGNYQKGQSHGSNIEVIETYRLAPTKYIQIVRVGTKYLVIAIGKDEISKLADLQAEELQLTVKTGEAVPDFKSILEKIKNLKK